MTQYASLITAVRFPPNFSPQNPNLTTMPLYMRLREHHCISPEYPVLTGGNHDGFDDGIRNGWFPKVSIHESGGIVRVEDTTNDYTSKYETYVEGRTNSHKDDTCSQCLFRRRREEHELQEKIRQQKEQNVSKSRELLNFADHLQQVPGVDPSSGDYENHEDEEDEPTDHGVGTSFVAGGAPSPAPSHNEEDEPTVDAVRTQVNTALGPGVNVDDVLEHELSESSSSSASESDHSDSDSEVDYVENTCNGIQDIIITGEVTYLFC